MVEVRASNRWPLLGYGVLTAGNAAQIALYLLGPAAAQDTTLARTWSLWNLAFLGMLPPRPSRPESVAVWLLLVAGLCGVFFLGHRYFRGRFLILALLLALPLVAVMPGSDPSRESQAWMAAITIVLWHVALAAAAVEALRMRADIRGFLWLGAVLALLGFALAYPLGPCLAVALAGAWLILVRRRTPDSRAATPA